MSEETNCSQDKLTLLTNKIERESRFTRLLVVICMFASMFVTLVTFNQSMSVMPTMVVNEYMSRLDNFYDMWKIYERTRWQKLPETTVPVVKPAPKKTK